MKLGVLAKRGATFVRSGVQHTMLPPCLNRPRFGTLLRSAGPSVLPTTAEAAETEAEEAPLSLSKAVIDIDTSIYDRQLSQKVREITASLREVLPGLPAPEVFPSAPLGYRLRSEFQVWHEKASNEKWYIMTIRKPRPAEPAQPDEAAASDSGRAQPGPGNAGAAQAAQSRTGDADAAPSPSSSSDPSSSAAIEPGSQPASTPGKGPRRTKKRKPRGPIYERIRIDHFPAGPPLMNEILQAVIQAANKSPALGESLFQVNVHTTLSGESMATLIYHRKLDAAWEEAARELRASLGRLPSCRPAFLPHVIGRSRGQRIDLDANHVTERLTVPGGPTLSYMQVEETFSQPNGGVCEKMLGWARGATAGLGGDLLELYCGNGNFSIALSDNFGSVVATELNAASVAAARRNIEMNGRGNVHVAVAPAAEFAEAWRTGRKVPGLESLDLSALSLRTLLVDPPRAGLDPATVALCRDFQHIVYVSCNPETLKKNLGELSDAYRAVRFAVFDQFPYTGHLECGVLLEAWGEAAAAAGAPEASKP